MKSPERIDCAIRHVNGYLRLTQVTAAGRHNEIFLTYAQALLLAGHITALQDEPKAWAVPGEVAA